jgi:hypothetical protein
MTCPHELYQFLRRCHSENSLRCRWIVIPSIMRIYLIIFLPPLFYQHFNLVKCGKDLPVKQFISEPAVKRLNITILPVVAQLNVQGLDS